MSRSSASAASEAAALDVRGDPSAALQRADLLLAELVDMTPGPARARAEALLEARASWALRLLGDPVSAARRALDAERLAGESGDADTLAAARIALGQVYYQIGYMAEARRNLARAVASPDVAAELRVQAHMNIAAAWRSEGRLDEAIGRFDALVDQRLAVPDELWATVLINAASAWHQVDRTLEAQEALDQARSLSDRPDLGLWCGVIGAWIAAREGNVARAQVLAAPSLTETTDLASSGVRAWADAAVRVGDVTAMRDVGSALQAVLKRCEDAGDRREARELRVTLAQVCETRGDLLGAVRHLRHARKLEEEGQRASAGLALEQEALRVELVRMQAEADSMRLHQGELSDARDRLQAAEAAIHRRTRALVHDLRNPLMGLQAHIELMDADDPQDVRHRMEALQRTLDRIEGMLASAMRFDPAGRSMVDLGRIVEDSCVAFRALAATKSQSLTVTMPGGVQVSGNARDLGRVVDNLLSNAVKYGPAGGAIAVIVRDRDAVVELSVLDDGPGFPGLSVDDGLVYGAQLGSAATGGEASTGLGLNAVHELVSRLGGTVSLGNRPDGGAIVRVSLRR